MRKNQKILFTLAAILFIAFFSFDFRNQIPKSVPVVSVSNKSPDQIQTPKSEPKQDPKKFIQVIRVIDGDTIVVDINAEQVHIRLIGINSPELNDKRAQVKCFAKKAKEEAEKLLDGKNVELEKDPTQGDYDKYGRLLAYVFLENGSFFNKLMIEEGYAYEYTYRLPYKYQTEFKTAQEESRIAQRGLWSANICNSN